MRHLTEHERRMASCVGGWAKPGRRGRSVQDNKDGCQMGQAAPCGRGGRLLLQPPSLPSQSPPAMCAVTETLRRQRHTSDQIAAGSRCHRPPSAAFFVDQIGCAIRNRPSRAPLRAREPRRDHSHRHQKARAFRASWPPHHRRPHRPEQQPRHRWSSSMSALRITPAAHSPRSSPTRRSDSAVPFLEAAVAYYKNLGVTSRAS